MGFGADFGRLREILFGLVRTIQFEGDFRCFVALPNCQRAIRSQGVGDLERTPYKSSLLFSSNPRNYRPLSSIIPNHY